MQLSIIALTAVSLLALPVAQAQERKPSTAEDRAKAVEIARSLESDPLAKDAKEKRNWLVHWLIDVPDVKVKVCGTLVPALLESKKNYSAEIFTQMVPSAAAFVIQHPDRATDDAAVYMAALEGVLRSYEAILKVKPKAKWPSLDALLEKRDKGELMDYVQSVAAHCK